MPPLGSEPAEDTLHADLEAAFDGIASGDGGGAPAETTEIKTQSTEPGAAADASKGSAAVASTATDDRARGPDGKFLPKYATAAAAAPAPKAAAVGAEKRPAAAPIPPIPSTDATKASTVAPSTAPDAPPVGWTADAKTEWQSLSPAIKAAVLKREVEMSAGGRQWSEEKRRYEEIVAPVRQAASRRGISEAEGIQRLMHAQDRLDADPAAAIQWLADAYRVPITINGRNDRNGTDPINGQPAADVSSRIESPVRAPSDPRLDALWQRVQDQERRDTDMTVQKVTSFATDPAHPYFDALNSEIMAMLPILKARNPTATPEVLLQGAYDHAVWANPETRRALQAEMAAATAATNGASRAESVAKSRLAASSLRPGAPAGIPAVEPRESIREEILAAWGDAR